MSLLPRLFPNIRPLLEKAKERAKASFLSTTNTIIGILVGISTLIVYGLDITDKLIDSDTDISKNQETEIVKNKTEVKKQELPKKNLNQSSSLTTKPNNSTKIVASPKEPTYFNKNESLLENRSLALFIKNSKNAIHEEFQNKLSNAFQLKNTLASTSFFNNKSISHYNSFYSANPSWLKSTKIEDYTNKYLVGTVKINQSSSSADSDISIVNISFQGKLVNIRKNKSIPITKQVRETNYQEFKAYENAYSRLCNEIVNATNSFIAN